MNKTGYYTMENDHFEYLQLKFYKPCISGMGCLLKQGPL